MNLNDDNNDLEIVPVTQHQQVAKAHKKRKGRADSHREGTYDSEHEREYEPDYQDDNDSRDQRDKREHQSRQQRDESQRSEYNQFQFDEEFQKQLRPQSKFTSILALIAVGLGGFALYKLYEPSLFATNEAKVTKYVSLEEFEKYKTQVEDQLAQTRRNLQQDYDRLRQSNQQELEIIKLRIQVLQTAVESPSRFTPGLALGGPASLNNGLVSGVGTVGNVGGVASGSVNLSGGNDNLSTVLANYVTKSSLDYVIDNLRVNLVDQLINITNGNEEVRSLLQQRASGLSEEAPGRFGRYGRDDQEQQDDTGASTPGLNSPSLNAPGSQNSTPNANTSGPSSSDANFDAETDFSKLTPEQVDQLVKTLTSNESFKVYLASLMAQYALTNPGASPEKAQQEVLTSLLTALKDGASLEVAQKATQEVTANLDTQLKQKTAQLTELAGQAQQAADAASQSANAAADSLAQAREVVDTANKHLPGVLDSLKKEATDHLQAQMASTASAISQAAQTQLLNSFNSVTLPQVKKELTTQVNQLAKDQVAQQLAQQVKSTQAALTKAGQETVATTKQELDKAKQGAAKALSDQANALTQQAEQAQQALGQFVDGKREQVAQQAATQAYDLAREQFVTEFLPPVQTEVANEIKQQAQHANSALGAGLTSHANTIFTQGLAQAQSIFLGQNLELAQTYIDHFYPVDQVVGALEVAKVFAPAAVVKAITADIAALTKNLQGADKASAALVTSQLANQVNNLLTQVGNLPSVLPARPENPTPQEESTWRQATASFFGKFITAEKNGNPLQGTNADFYIKENLSLALRNALLALQANNLAVYQQALADVVEKATLYFSNDEPAVNEFVNQARRLGKVDFSYRAGYKLTALTAYKTYAKELEQKRKPEVPPLTLPEPEDKPASKATSAATNAESQSASAPTNAPASTETVPAANTPAPAANASQADPARAEPTAPTPSTTGK